MKRNRTRLYSFVDEDTEELGKPFGLCDICSKWYKVRWSVVRMTEPVRRLANDSLLPCIFCKHGNSTSKMKKLAKEANKVWIGEK